MRILPRLRIPRGKRLRSRINKRNCTTVEYRSKEGKIPDAPANILLSKFRQSDRNVASPLRFHESSPNDEFRAFPCFPWLKLSSCLGIRNRKDGERRRKEESLKVKGTFGEIFRGQAGRSPFGGIRAHSRKFAVPKDLRASGSCAFQARGFSAFSPSGVSPHGVIFVPHFMRSEKPSRNPAPKKEIP